MYDWANSAFATSGVAAIFPVYFVVLFKDSLGESGTFFGIDLTASAVWSVGVALSTAVVALSSPALGVIADRVPIKKALLAVYTFTGALFTVLSFFAVYTGEAWLWMFGMFSLANVGFAGSLVFYNSFLPHLAPRNLQDDVSSRGFAYGYIGGGLLLVVHLALILAVQDSDISDLVTRCVMSSVGVWWFGWSLWTLKVLPEPPLQQAVTGLNPLSAATLAFSELARTFRAISRFEVVSIYLASYLLFNDGLQTVMAIGGAFAADVLRIPLAFNMATILIIQFVAAPGALVFSRLARRTSTKIALIIALLVWMLVVLLGVALVPLMPEEHGDFDYRLEYDGDAGAYVTVHAPDTADETLPTGFAERLSEGESVTAGAVRRLLEDAPRVEDFPYGISIRGGTLDGETALGAAHPALLGEGPLDWWPSFVRTVLWEPLGMKTGYQWIMLGVLVGCVIGGSQALARSLFSQITPESRSGEFFSFFGFMSRASVVFGPILYTFVAALIDTRAAIASLLALIVAGTIMLKWVNVEEGARVAAEEDAKGRVQPQILQP